MQSYVVQSKHHTILIDSCVGNHKERPFLPKWHQKTDTTYIDNLDPNDANVRVFNLLELNSVFIELISHPLAVEIASCLLDDDFVVSNFTANIAKPGSRSMVVHSDLAIVLPEPWQAAWSLNVIWCLDDVHAALQAAGEFAEPAAAGEDLGLDDYCTVWTLRNGDD